eukprot:scaffold30794_cov46-Cyclotella_meneghiniana.AAC.2
MFHKNDIDRNRNNISCIGGERRLKHSIDSYHLAHLLNCSNDVRHQYYRCYREIAATTMDKNGKYTTINLISGHQIAGAIADDGIRKYRATGGW